MSKKKFYLQCTRSVVGNSAMWWALNDRGYTCDIRCAKIFDEDDPKLKELRDIDVPWPKEVVDRLVQHHVDVQDLHYKNNDGNLADFPHTLAQWRPDLCITTPPAGDRSENG